ncbi:PhoH family protein [Macrococcus sp. DPC7161]|uniref:PhoH family protein n=1 Tax=Macrococcus sp. DPC7161 TaxID=2507060 RepID=UPI00100BB140|nr:PhoH family protein [Macrococcus sp. DPC7161]RXK19393.1 PhoH family protein [Macrococcus sp. DPC7161]
MPNPIIFENLNEAQSIVGNHDEHIMYLEEVFNVEIHTRGSELTVEGDAVAVEQTVQLIENLIKIIQKGSQVTFKDVQSAVMMSKNGTIKHLSQLYDEEITKDANGKAIRAKTLSQRLYVHQIKNNDLVFGIGPAGTGKTFLAVVMALKELRAGTVKKIVLTRPAVEAGESLGFLPGDLKEKVDPYLRPLYDGLHFVLGKEHTERLIERGVIEIAPLAYMRGRTLEDAFIILDEAQNTTHPQMKMFLTRLGFGSKMVITGDETQIDLPRGVKSGLIEAESRLSKVKGIAIHKFDALDVVRHPLVGKIINAYEGDV